MQERRAYPPASEHDLNVLVRYVAYADWLVLAVVLLYHAVAPQAASPLSVGIVVTLYAAVSIVLRLPLGFLPSPPARLEFETWSMIAFIAAVVWLTGGAQSPLQSLYLLPIVLAALVLPGWRLALLLVVVVAAYVLVAAFDAGGGLRWPALAGRLLVAVGPLIAVGWLTSQLGTAVLTARRHARGLVEGDALTGLGSRRAFLDVLKRELADEVRHGRPATLLMVDLDGSRRLNEQYGLETGNAALKLVAEALRRALRDSDYAARWSGDEFVVLLLGADAAAAQVVAQRFRHAVYATTLDTGARHLRCSVSMGIASLPADGTDGASLLAAAERRLERERELKRTTAAAAGAA